MGEIEAQGKIMAALNPPVCDFGLPAIDFDLPGTDGQRHTLASCRGPNGLLVMFICNHCPYVKAVIDRIVRGTGSPSTFSAADARSCTNRLDGLLRRNTKPWTDKA